MTKEDIGNYTRRITQGNKSEIIVVLYDIYFSYEQDIRDALASGDNDALCAAVRHTNDVAEHLKNALNFDYDISANLYVLYDYVQRCLARVLYRRKVEDVDQAAAVMRELRDAFIEVAKADTSGQAMRNAQSVTVGMTYGRGELSEMTDFDSNRGFLA